MRLEQFVIGRPESDLTLTAVLRQRLGLSWSAAKKLVLKRQVKLNGAFLTDPVQRMKPGMRVEVHGSSPLPPKQAVSPAIRPRKPRRPDEKPKAAPAPRPAAREPQEPREVKVTLSPDVIHYSDEQIVVANKPHGLTTMRHAEEAAEFGKGRKYLPTTLEDQLPTLLGTPDRKVTAVHRIDRDTSGLVVFARTKPATQSLLKQFRKHSIERKYLAITRGKPTQARVESLLVRDRGDGRRGSDPNAGDEGQRAVTFVRVVEELGDFCLVECRLETGRTHQVRIHLGEMGCPLAGETVYDRPLNGAPLPDGSGAHRQMLHAARLGIVHPETGATMAWDALLPRDMANLCERLREIRDASRAEAGPAGV